MPLSLTWFDYIILLITLVSVVLGLIKGVLREVVSLVSLILASVLSFRYGDVAGSLFSWWSSETVRYIAGFITIFLVILIIGVLIGITLKNMAKGIGLGGLDHGLGAFFGLIRGMFFSLILIFLVANTAASSSDWFQQSATRQWAHSVIVWLKTFTPSSLHQNDVMQNATPQLKTEAVSHVMKHALKQIQHHATKLNEQLAKG